MDSSWKSRRQSGKVDGGSILYFSNVLGNKDARSLSKEEAEREKILAETTGRNSNGRFIIALSLRQSADYLGGTCLQNENFFYKLEQRLLESTVLREQYVDFMHEYEEHYHMSEVV